MRTEWVDESQMQLSKFTKGAKNTFIDQIYKNGLSKEKSSPSPNSYDVQKAFNNNIPRVYGGRAGTDYRTTFVTEITVVKKETPGPSQYSTVPMVRVF